MADFICDDTTSESSEDERPRKRKKPDKKKKNDSGEEDEVDPEETEKPGNVLDPIKFGKSMMELSLILVGRSQ